MNLSQLPCFAALALLLVSFVLGTTNAFVPQPLTPPTTTTSPRTSLPMVSPSPSRENEIRRKIAQLKKQGKISPKNNPKEAQLNEYERKVQKKLGTSKAKLLGIHTDDTIDDEENDNNNEKDKRPSGRIGSLINQEEQAASYYGKVMEELSLSSDKEMNILDRSLYENELDNDEEYYNDDDDGDENNDEDNEEELMELVAAKLAEKNALERAAREAREKEERQQKIQDIKEKRQLEKQKEEEEAAARLRQQQQQELVEYDKQRTTSVGGLYTKNETAVKETYKPSKSGTWGVFDRPKDISSAFGGGRRIGPGYSNEQGKIDTVEQTRNRLQRYREKVGIDVESEKIHKDEIEEARRIGSYAMERGVYASAVSALEKVTKYCSSNSPVGGMVFLELAMAYEAVGRTSEAITIYTTLTTCRIEDIKFNAKRLLYGIQAMEFMRNEAKIKDFSRKKIKNTFIETTGLNNIAANFDDVYATAYIDLSQGKYKKLTESVVRNNREARQILLKATGAGEIERIKVVQALRSISRHFDDELDKEIESNIQKNREPVAMMDGKPIVATILSADNQFAVANTLDEFVLATPQDMIENLNGEWRLQLLADKRGEGVKYYNTSVSWQSIDTTKTATTTTTSDDDTTPTSRNTNEITFRSVGKSGLFQIEQSGCIKYNEKYRIITPINKKMEGGFNNPFANLFGATETGAAGAVGTPHQILSVDSILLITRLAPTIRKSDGTRNNGDDSQKEYFAVWRRVEPGTYSSSLKR